jgi:hypothetical protein
VALVPFRLRKDMTMRPTRLPLFLEIPLLLGLVACASPGSIGARFSETGALLLDGPAARMTPAYVAQERARSVPLLYQFAIDAGQLPPVPGNAAAAVGDPLVAQEVALSQVRDWKKVTLAGEAYIDKQCNDFLTALDVLEKSKKTTLANLNSVQSATVGIMGLLRTAQQAIGITGVSFGLAAALFDQTASTVLYQLPASSITAIVEAQRQSLRYQETAEHASLEWTNIDNRAGASGRLATYIQYCAPLTIEASITKVLNRTAIDSAGNLVVTSTPPAAAGGTPAPVQPGPPEAPPQSSMVIVPAPPSSPPAPPRPRSGGTGSVGRPTPSTVIPPAAAGGANTIRAIRPGCSPVEPDAIALKKGEIIQFIEGLETKPGESVDPARKRKLDAVYAAIAEFSKQEPQNALPPAPPDRERIEVRNAVNYIFRHVCSADRLSDLTARLAPLR